MIFRPLILALIWATLTAFAGTAEARTDIAVAVYRGAAACEECSQAAKSAIEALDPRYKVTFVGPRERIDVTRDSLSRFAIYVQPGGGQDIPAAMRALGRRRIAAIRTFVSQGGGYLGLCMGAYLADSNNIGLIADALDSEVGRPGSPVTSIEDTAVAVVWNGKADSVFYQDGPYFPPSAEGGFRPLATYANQDIAAARYTFGKGVVVLSGPHPEADQGWFQDAGLALASMPKTDPLRSLLAEFPR